MNLPLEFLVAQWARQLGLWVATAESCTGGLIGHLLTNVPGSSEYYRGGVVAYSNEVKQSLLGVGTETLNRFGAVSRETVLEMAKGAGDRLRADIGLSVSGIAGPGGGSLEKPVGTVWIGLNSLAQAQAWCFHFTGDRLTIKQQAAQKAMEVLAEHLKATLANS